MSCNRKLKVHGTWKQAVEGTLRARTTGGYILLELRKGRIYFAFIAWCFWERIALKLQHYFSEMVFENSRSALN
jgi:hypothetical protein